MGAIECATCGYDLSAHTDAYRPGVLCPECGDANAARTRFERVGVAGSLPHSMQAMLWAAVLTVGGLVTVCLPQKPSTGGAVGFYGWVMLVAAGILIVREYLKRRLARARDKTSG